MTAAAAHAIPDAIQYGDGEYAVAWKPLSDRQEEFVTSTEFEVLYGGAKGGAKTDCLVASALGQINRSAYKALLLRNTFPELQEIRDRTGDLYPKLGGVWHAGEERWIFPGGASIELGYCEIPKHAKRYQGREFAWIGYDEIGNLKDEQTWEILKAECRSRDPHVMRMLRATANPGGVAHAWLKRRFIATCGKLGEFVWIDDKTGLTRRFIPASVKDNPIYSGDKQYMAQLLSLPEMTRRQLLDGDWDAGEGLALDELAEATHWISPAPRRIPAGWTLFGAFDWGFAHKFAFGLFGVDEAGAIALIDSAHGRRLGEADIFERILGVLTKWGVSLTRLSFTVAGADVGNVVQARGQMLPSISEQFANWGMPLIETDARSGSRVSTLNNMRRYIAVKNADGTMRAPLFTLWATEGNRIVFDCLTSRVTDPDNREDVLKTDTDPQTGEGGDDPYDMLRYGLAMRPLLPVAAASRVKFNRDRDDGLVARKAAEVGKKATAAPVRYVQPFKLERST